MLALKYQMYLFFIHYLPNSCQNILGRKTTLYYIVLDEAKTSTQNCSSLLSFSAQAEDPREESCFFGLKIEIEERTDISLPGI